MPSSIKEQLQSCFVLYLQCGEVHCTPMLTMCLQESEGDSEEMWDRSSESESSSSDEEVRPLGTLTADFFRKKLVDHAMIHNLRLLLLVALLHVKNNSTLIYSYIRIMPVVCPSHLDPWVQTARS